jgi:YgiT-type zinc finger domain-containing protein
MEMITFCPTCGSAKIRKVRRKWTGTYRNQAYTVPALQFYECPDCGEEVYDRLAMRNIEAHSPAFANRRTQRRST